MDEDKLAKGSLRLMFHSAIPQNLIAGEWSAPISLSVSNECGFFKPDLYPGLKDWKVQCYALHAKDNSSEPIPLDVEMIAPFASRKPFGIVTLKIKTNLQLLGFHLLLRVNNNDETSEKANAVMPIVSPRALNVGEGGEEADDFISCKRLVELCRFGHWG